jgi:outer membrane biosynthesis protein TonB
MRKFLLITAMVLVSATAQAQTRGLTLASNDEPVAAEPQKAAETPKAVEAPKFVERPPAVDAKVEQPKAEPVAPAVEKSAEAPKAEAPKETIKAEKPKHRHSSMQARVIYELHRHGIYW